MPLHDWTRVEANLFHDFHQSWVVAMSRALNTGGLPPGYFALLERPVPSFPAGGLPRTEWLERLESGPDADAPSPPEVEQESEPAIFLRLANRIVIRSENGRVATVVAVVSPGHKVRGETLRLFVDKHVEFLARGICLLVIDPHPLTPPDAHGGHHYELWRDWPPEAESAWLMLDDQAELAAAFDAGPPWKVFVEPLRVGESLPEMPLFLGPGHSVPFPLEPSYMAAWDGFPRVLRPLLEGSTDG